MAAIGVDYSTRSIDVALVEGQKLHYSKAFDLGLDRRGLAVRAALQDALGRAAFLGLSVNLWLEEPWARAEAGIRSAIKLHRIPHYIECVAEQLDLPWNEVPVQTWHAHILGSGRIKSATGKTASLRYVELVFGHRASSHNASDAICIAAYGDAKSRLEGRLA